MIKYAEEHADADKKRREELEIRNQAESLVYSTRSFMDENKDKVSEDIRTKVEEAAKGVEKALEGDDIDAVKSAVEKLSTESQEMGKAIYAQEAAQGTTEAGTAGSSDDDNVVDAEVVDEDTDNKDGDK